MSCECGHGQGCHADERSVCFGDEGECGCVEFQDARSAAMTRDQRNQLRHLIDQAKRRQLAAHKPPGRNQAARRATYRAYYQRNRTRILARRAASRAA